MVSITIADGVATFRLVGLHKLWALRSSLEVPVKDIVTVEAGVPVAHGGWAGWRLPGTWLPGLITAGSYLKNREWTFWDVTTPRRTITVTTKDHRFSRVIVDVADPEADIARLTEAAAAA